MVCLQKQVFKVTITASVRKIPIEPACQTLELSDRVRASPAQPA